MTVQPITLRFLMFIIMRNAIAAEFLSHGIHFPFVLSQSRRRLFNTTTVLPSWPTTPTVSGIFPSIAQVTGFFLTIDPRLVIQANNSGSATRSAGSAEHVTVCAPSQTIVCSYDRPWGERNTVIFFASGSTIQYSFTPASA